MRCIFKCMQPISNAILDFSASAAADNEEADFTTDTRALHDE